MSQCNTVKTIRYVVVLLLVLLSLFGGRQWGERRATARPSRISDTVIVYRTKSENRPVYSSLKLKSWDIVVPRVIFDTDSVETVRCDTIPYAVHDTVFVPITEQYYERLDGRLRLWISGYKPSLDRWELDEKETIINNTTRRRLGFSATVGPSVIVTPGGDIKGGLGLTAGVSWNF